MCLKACQLHLGPVGRCNFEQGKRSERLEHRRFLEEVFLFSTRLCGVLHVFVFVWVGRIFCIPRYLSNPKASKQAGKGTEIKRVHLGRSSHGSTGLSWTTHDHTWPHFIGYTKDTSLTTHSFSDHLSPFLTGSQLISMRHVKSHLWLFVNCCLASQEIVSEYIAGMPQHATTCKSTPTACQLLQLRPDWKSSLQLSDKGTDDT